MKLSRLFVFAALVLWPLYTASPAMAQNAPAAPAATTTTAPAPAATNTPPAPANNTPSGVTAAPAAPPLQLPATESLGQPETFNPDGSPATPQPAPPPSGAVPAWMQYQNPYSGEENDISNANRTSDEIIAWASHAATSALTLTPTDMNNQFGEIKKSFSPQGWSEYGAYVQQAQIVDMVQNRQYSVNAIIKNGALIVDSGAANGSYHWLVKLPIMVTLLHDDGQGHPQAMQGGDFDLTLQVGRMPQGSGAPDNMAVESWRIAAKPADTTP